MSKSYTVVFNTDAVEQLGSFIQAMKQEGIEVSALCQGDAILKAEALVHYFPAELTPEVIEGFCNKYQEMEDYHVSQQEEIV
ncbi:hypothetical protein [Pseudomonas phage LUZ7]|uniref:Uncharacterized protein n=1 Tax=Pseudomonas phage LUZ7 TaxID=655097 RepID=C8ZKE4_9CAUD|nr:hypothetical protein PP-LUZ7_gp050 [Pseudomonas phage LUZ7]CAZ66191.1 hypothetical protein [Pseudomonas phage LUZ7]